MRILIDIGHPAHVHLFKHFAWEMENKGHEIFFTCREKEFEIYLLEKYGFKYLSFGRKYNSTVGKLWGLLKFDIQELLAGFKFKPDILLSHGSIYASHAAFLLRKPHIALEDTGNMEQIRFYRPFSSTILVPESLSHQLGGKEIRYNGYHELAYLHRNKFLPDIKTLKKAGIQKDGKFAILRFVSWNASHDVGQSGLNEKEKRSIIKILQDHNYKILITSEGTLPGDIEKYRLKIPAEKLHDLLAYATLVITEGATIANESAIIGTPAIYINSRKACIGDLEKYGLLFRFKDYTGVIDKVIEIVELSIEERIKRRHELLAGKIDLTTFLIWFVEEYPGSLNECKTNPEVVNEF